MVDCVQVECVGTRLASQEGCDWWLTGCNPFAILGMRCSTRTALLPLNPSLHRLERGFSFEPANWHPWLCLYRVFDKQGGKATKYRLWRVAIKKGHPVREVALHSCPRRHRRNRVTEKTVRKISVSKFRPIRGRLLNYTISGRVEVCVLNGNYGLGT